MAGIALGGISEEPPIRMRNVPGCDGLGRTLDLYETHAAITGNGEAAGLVEVMRNKVHMRGGSPVVVAEAVRITHVRTKSPHGSV
jgi:hypothetical protein